MGASLYEFRDLDLMHKLADLADYDGYVESAALTEGIGLGDGKQAIAVRLSWMRRFGMVEFNEEKRMWRLTDGGERVTKSHMRAAQSRVIEAIPDESMVEVMASVTSRYMHGEPMLAHMLKREFLFGTQAQPARRRR